MQRADLWPNPGAAHGHTAAGLGNKARGKSKAGELQVRQPRSAGEQGSNPDAPRCSRARRKIGVGSTTGRDGEEGGLQGRILLP